MGFFKKISDKMNRKYTYIVDLEAFRNYLERTVSFSLEEDLEAVTDVNVFMQGEKHRVQGWNYAASTSEEKSEKGIIFYYDDLEFTSVEELINQKYKDAPPYFKIRLNWGDEIGLNAYREQHPELKIEDYE